jgi:hypothetical protein
MSDVHQFPAGDQVTGPSASKPVPLRWNDVAGLREWLGDLRNQVLDVLAAGEDATRRPRKRMFSRYEANRRLRAAERAILCLLAAAERGLPSEETENE